jgi:redox-sensitive bicupin YhaK (pirin superfamily)
MAGEVVLNGRERAKTHDFVIFQNSGERITVQASTDAQLLVLSGEPIDEPVVQYGPFVMNSEREILQAFHDFNDGKFGHLDD